MRVDFVTGVYAGETPDHRVDWPPSPFRLFEAFVAAAGELAGRPGRRTPEEEAALQWMEGHPPTGLVLPREEEVRFVETHVYVPSNETIGFEKRRQRRVFHRAVLLGAPTIWYVWDEHPGEALFRTLEEMAARIPYLGTSRAPAIVSVSQAPPSPTHVRWAGTGARSPRAGVVRVRVPVPGVLAKVDEQYEAERGETAVAQPTKRGRVRADTGAFERVRRHLHVKEHDRFKGLGEDMAVYEAQEPVVMPDPMAEILDVLRFVVAGEGRHLHVGPEDWSLVTSAVRLAVISLYGQDGNCPVGLHGHGAPDERRVLFVPAVAVGRHAGGRALGVMVLVDEGALSEEEKKELRVKVLQVREVRLRRLGAVGLAPVSDWDDDLPRALRRWTWSRPSRVWATVTPAVLELHAKARPGASAEDLVRRSFGRIGLRPVEVTLSRRPVLPGAPHAAAVAALRLKTVDVPGRAERRVVVSEDRPLVHVVARFGTPVAGPVVIGAWRTYGLGLMAPVHEREEV